MLYVSTHGQSRVGLVEAVRRCYAPDGGLYLPECLPQLPRAYFNNIQEMSLTEVAYVVASAFLSELTDRAVLKEVVESAFNFPIPLVSIDGQTRLLELFNGPTLAFKDISARFMATYLRTFPARGSRVTLLVATTGNTGSAIARAFAGEKGVDVLILFPHGAMDSRARMQFAGVAPNVSAVEVAGSISDCKRMVRETVTDAEFAEKATVVCGNTHNIMRIIPQIAYFFYAYGRLRLRERHPDGFTVALPCGNLSNLTSAVMARRMGLPMGRIVAGCTVNDSLVRVLDGSLAPEDVTAGARHTLAPAMDSGYPTNLPRLLRLYDGSVERMASEIIGAAVTDDEIARTVCEVQREHGYLTDTHTAVALAAARRVAPVGVPTVVLATAHPAKSPEIMHAVIGRRPELPGASECFNSIETVRVPRMAPTSAALKKYILTRLTR